MNNELLDRLYLNPILEVNIHQKKINSIRQKDIDGSSSEKYTLSSSRPVTDLFKGLNGTVIIQNWNTKKNIPNDIGELLNLPSLIDRQKIMKLDKFDLKKLSNKPND